MSNIVDEAGLAVFRKISDLWSGARADSLIDYTKVARVEPIVLIDTDCMLLDTAELTAIQESLLSIFAGYYLQAVNISTTVGKVEVFGHLDRLNPSRDALNSAGDTAGWLLAQESYEHRLPMPGNQIAMEAEQERSEVALGRDTVKELKELSNLSVGKMLHVEITDGLHKATVSVAVRLLASSLPTERLVHILSVGSEDTSMRGRYHEWRAGRLDFIRDLCLCEDLIEEHRKNLIEDKTGIYGAILKRARGNSLSTIFSGNPSIATASNLVIMSSDSARQLEAKVGGKLSNFGIRQKVFKNTYMMIMAVVDKEWGQVTFYHRGIQHPTEVSIAALKSSSKGSGPDVSDILKAYQVGSAPSL